ncbi:hypothetical protein [Promicromonospora sp. NPDC023805]|uniref:hypothetical protein n=1 Tax=Promicromonospora sp. NPDC023805 TaxID=3154696 RepID=UPI0033E439F1
MPLQYLAGQRLTADALQRAVPDRVRQNSDQSVTSSITPVASSIAITVDGLLKIDLELRFTPGGGGIRWDWLDAGSVTFIHRAVGAAGSAATGNPSDVSSMHWRAMPDFATDVSINQFNNFTTHRGTETLVVDGSGTLTLRFAQDASNAVATTLSAESYALITRLGS